MKKLCCIIPLMIMLSGCSNVSLLMVVNKSDHHLSVWFKPNYLDTSEGTLILKAFEITRWKKDEPILGKQIRLAQTHNVSRDNYHADLPPNCVVVMGEAINVDFHDSVQRKMMLERIGIFDIYAKQTWSNHCSGVFCDDLCKVYSKTRAAIVYGD